MTQRLARVTRSAANPLRRENFSRAKSRLKQSVSHLASTEVHRGNDRIENAMATALVAAQAAAKQAHIPVPSEPAKAWWPMRAAALVATGMASGLESAYWHGVHSSPYLGLSWRWFKFLGQGVLSPAIRAAVSTLSCFNHRVSLIEANVKFANSETQLDTPRAKKRKRQKPGDGRFRRRRGSHQKFGRRARVLLARSVRVLGGSAPRRR
jgi:hypothetical protein